MIKYDLIREQLLYEGTLREDHFFTPDPLDEKWILTTHSSPYLESLHQLNLSKAAIRKMGFPLSKQLIQREITIAGGTVACCEYAMNYGISMNVAGGTHHAYRNHGEGFCLLNDQAIAANYVIHRELATKVLIVDLDVHQGNGTASLFRTSDQVVTLSIHGANNYPLKKEFSTVDIALPDGARDQLYLQVLEKTLVRLLEIHKPDFMFYQSGVDALDNDKLGRIGLSIQGLKERDRLVLSHAKKHQIPLVASMGGGYSSKLSDIIECHANTFRLAQEIYF